MRVAALTACMAFFLIGCNFVEYRPKPIDPLVNTAQFASKDPSSEAFQQYLRNNGYAQNDLPLNLWGLDELTYCALFFHPSLDLARAQWHAAESTVGVAAQRLLPTVKTKIENNSNPGQGNSPYAFGLAIDIALETSNKRNIRIENAQHLSQAAKLEVAQTAWGLRNQVAQSLIEYQFNQQQIQQLSDEQSLRAEIVALYQNRVDLGAGSNVELSTAKLLLQTANTALTAIQQNLVVARSKLASNLGLTPSKIAALPLADSGFSLPSALLAADQLPLDTSASGLQTAALYNRLDLRIALQRYAVAEAKLKLEIANQYPNLTISPGYIYEYGQKLLNMGLSGLLTLLNKNKPSIAEAIALREVEATQVQALQNKIISEANMANALLLQAQLFVKNQNQILSQQQYSTEQMTRRFNAGEIDRLELAFAKLELNNAEKNVGLALYQLQIARTQLENTLQQPLVASANKPNIENLSSKK
jgi:cobalt-zinc-cadmium efflux system outer membrane protein